MYLCAHLPQHCTCMLQCIGTRLQWNKALHFVVRKSFKFIIYWWLTLSWFVESKWHMILYVYTSVLNQHAVIILINTGHVCDCCNDYSNSNIILFIERSTLAFASLSHARTKVTHCPQNSLIPSWKLLKPWSLTIPIFDSPSPIPWTHPQGLVTWSTIQIAYRYVQ